MFSVCCSPWRRHRRTHPKTTKALDIGSKRDLFVDTHLIEGMSGLRLKLHTPVPKEIVMHHDKLWEGNGCSYYSIFRDGDIYRMYYEAWAHEPSSIPVHDILIAYAESKDGKTFHRWLEAFIRPGLRYTDNWVYGDNCQNWGLIETKSDLPGGPDEISIYATEHYWRGSYTNLRRFVLRVDGFVSVHASGKGGEFTTPPLSFEGKELEMNFSTSIAGSVRVEIQDASGKPISGYALADCPEILGDHLERVVAWKGGTDVSKLAGSSVRLRLVMRDADLYSIRFRP